jgi:carbamoyl-phosphate synthase large subunit
VRRINKVYEGQPNILDALINGEVQMMINTTAVSAQMISDSLSLRRTALLRGIPNYTTMPGARAAIEAISALQTGSLEVSPIQAYAEAS